MHLDLNITRTVSLCKTPRRLAVQGKFDLAVPDQSTRTWRAKMDLPDGPYLGAIVGPSGSGKTSIARELTKQLGGIFVAPKDEHGHACEPFPWPADASLVDGFDDALPINDVLKLLGSVGFSSPPHWCIPYGALSNGEQFRANLARGLAESQISAKPVCFDEFASLVHDVPAKIGSAALSKAVRESSMQVIVDTWRTDVLDWLEPDWVLFVNADGTTEFQTNRSTDNGQPTTDNSQGKAQRWVRPDVQLEIIRVDRSAWKLFRHAHYLSHEMHRDAQCFVGLIDGIPAVLTAAMQFPHPKRPGYREHRTVCLPDFQGIGLGNLMSEYIASLFLAKGRPYFSTTGNPAMVGKRRRSSNWRVCRKAGFAARGSGQKDDEKYQRGGSSNRITTGFEYIGPALPVEAGNFGLLSSDREKRAVHQQLCGRHDSVGASGGDEPTRSARGSKSKAKPATRKSGS